MIHIVCCLSAWFAQNIVSPLYLTCSTFALKWFIQYNVSPQDSCCTIFLKMIHTVHCLSSRFIQYITWLSLNFSHTVHCLSTWFIQDVVLYSLSIIYFFHIFSPTNSDDSFTLWTRCIQCIELSLNMTHTVPGTLSFSTGTYVVFQHDSFSTCTLSLNMIHTTRFIQYIVSQHDSYSTSSHNTIHTLHRLMIPAVHSLSTRIYTMYSLSTLSKHYSTFSLNMTYTVYILTQHDTYSILNLNTIHTIYRIHNMDHAASIILDGIKRRPNCCFWGSGSLFRQVVIPTGLYSDRSLFRQVDIPRNRSLFRQVVIPTGRYSDRSLFRQVDIPTNRSLFRQVVIPTGR